MKYPKLSLTLGVGLFTAFPLTQLSAQGVPEDLYAYEGFDYDAENPITDIGELDGGFGFSDDWTWNNNNGLQSGTGGYISDDNGLSYTDADGNVLVTTGAAINIVGSTNTHAQAFRNLENAESIAGGTYYISFLLIRHGQTDEEAWSTDSNWTGDDANPRSRNVHLSLLSAGTDGAMGGDQARVGSPSNQPVDAWTFQSGGITEQFTTAAYPDAGLEPFSNNTQFVVIKVEPGAGTDGTDYLSLYFDPVLSAEPETPVWEGDLTDDGPLNIDFGAIGLLAGNGSSLRAPGVGAFDEIRVGASWEAVAQYGADTDGDGISNAIDLDNDNDDLSNEEEAELGTNPLLADTDGDGESDKDEIDDGTDAIATTMAYEGFDYEAGTDLFADANGGTGWDGAYTIGNGGIAGQAIVQDGGLTYVDAEGHHLVVSGNHVKLDATVEGNQSAQFQRKLATALDAAVGTYYISFIGERQGEADPKLGDPPAYTYAPNAYGRNAHLSLLSDGLGEFAIIGNPSNQTSDTWKVRSEDLLLDSAVAFHGNQQFAVVKIEAGAGANGGDVISLYLSPSLAEESLNTPVVSGEVTSDGEGVEFILGGIGMYIGNANTERAAAQMLFDEIRVGLTWPSVTPWDIDTDADEDPNYADSDDDGDGLDDEDEVELGTNPLLADTDGDGVGDEDEIDDGTDAIGTTMAYEGFDYEAGTDLFANANGGTGWDGAYTIGNGGIAGQAIVQDGGLTYVDADGRHLLVSGNHAKLDATVEGNQSAQFQRKLATALDATVGTYYISFIGERQGDPDPQLGDPPAYTYAPNAYGRNAHLSLLSDGLDEFAIIGNPSNQTSDTWKVRSEDLFLDTGEAFHGNQQFAVVKVETGAGANGGDVISLFLAPELRTEGLNEPVVSGEITSDGEGAEFILGGIGMYIGNANAERAAAQMLYDELRVGLTWESVTPNDLDTDGDETLDGEDDDIDGDGLTNEEEAQLGTDPRLADTDADGVNDADEVEAGTDSTGTAIAYEGFDYEAGTDLLTDTPNGGTGWNGGWTINSSNGLEGQAVVQDGGLAYEDERGNILITSGNHVYVDTTIEGNKNAQFQRHLATVLDSAPGTYYISFIGQRQGDKDPILEGEETSSYFPNEYGRNAQLALLDDGFGEAGAVGNASNRLTDTWKLWSGNTELDSGGEGADSGVKFSYNQQFVVVRVDVEAGDHGGHILSLYLNPALSSEGLNEAVVHGEAADDITDGLDWALGGIGLYIGNSNDKRAAAEMSFDEIRVGKTWESVTPHDVDTDGDGLLDFADDDADNDGIKSQWEAYYGTNPLSPDTDSDGVTDADEIEAGTDPIGTPIAYESFEYAAGTDLLIDAPNGGTGWSAGWTINSSNGLEGQAVVQDSGLTYQDADGHMLLVKGNHVYVDTTIEGNKNAQFQRHLATVLDSAPGTYYISFIGQRQGEKDPILEGEETSSYFPNEYGRNAQFAFLDDGFGEAGAVGNASNRLTDTWKLWSGNTELDSGGEGANSGVQFSYNQQFVVVRVDVAAGDYGGNVLSLYLNPELEDEFANEPLVHGEAADDVTDGLDWALGGIGLYVGNSNDKRAAAEMAFDEIRIGRTWESVTPINYDTDGDGTLDSADDDIDGDGVANDEDAFPYDANESVDTDGDGIGNNADTDDDNDGSSDAAEAQLGTDPLDAESVSSTQTLELESTPGMYYNGDYEYLTVTYSTNDRANAPDTLAFRVHYNSALVTLDYLPLDEFADGTEVTLDNDDTGDSDGSTLTDKYIEVTITGTEGAAWLNESATLPVEIGEVEVNSLGADISVQENTYTELRLSPVEQEEGFYFEGDSQIVRLLLWFYDDAYGWIYPYTDVEELVYSEEFESWLWVVDALSDDDAFAYFYAQESWLYLNFTYGGWFFHYGLNDWALVIPGQ